MQQNRLANGREDEKNEQWPEEITAERRTRGGNLDKLRLDKGRQMDYGIKSFEDNKRTNN